jgi:two-component system, sensor histidine kinase
VNLLRNSLRGLSPIEARIELQTLQDSWASAPSSIYGQALGLFLLCWMVRDWPVPVIAWLLPAVGLCVIWTLATVSTRRRRHHDIPAEQFTLWRERLLWWHGAQSSLWGMMAAGLLGAASIEWKMTLVAAVIVYGFTVTLSTIQDWGAAFAGSVPLLLLTAARLAMFGTSDTAYLALVLVVSLMTCLIVAQTISRRLREGTLLRHENADLVLQLRDEINKVTLAKARAESADRQKGEFFAAASHDLRQPLHVMMLLGSALRPHVSAEQGAPLLTKIQTTLSSLSTMFEKMFDVARIDAQRIEYKSQALPLAQLWAKLDTEFSALCEHKGLQWHIEPTTLWVQADPHLLERILRNLLNNAVRYTEHGEVRLRARVRGAAVVCQVWDTGVGIARHHRYRIFEDYFQANNEARRSGEGLGLGLAVVRRLSLLGPTPVSLLSRLGRGSVFSVQLPRLIPSEATPPPPLATPMPASTALAHAAPDAAPADTAPRPSRPRAVLLIDDEPDVLDSTALVLQQNGWLTAAGATPEAALEALISLQASGAMEEGDMPVAMISDHRLGLRINGLDVLRQLRYEFGEELPAFLLTGEASSSLELETEAEGVTLLHKPLQAEMLMHLLDDRTREAQAAA